jgi:hypothetical protein
VDYRNRNVVERGFFTVKQWPVSPPRYDKLALTFRRGAVLKAIVTWLRALGDTPELYWPETLVVVARRPGAAPWASCSDPSREIVLKAPRN